MDYSQYAALARIFPAPVRNPSPKKKPLRAVPPAPGVASRTKPGIVPMRTHATWR